MTSCVFVYVQYMHVYKYIRYIYIYIYHSIKFDFTWCNVMERRKVILCGVMWCRNVCVCVCVCVCNYLYILIDITLLWYLSVLGTRDKLEQCDTCLPQLNRVEHWYDSNRNEEDDQDHTSIAGSTTIDLVQFLQWCSLFQALRWRVVRVVRIDCEGIPPTASTKACC